MKNNPHSIGSRHINKMTQVKNIYL
jgi:hypothetical protein